MKSDGTVWGWGNNDSGQLGDGTMTRRWLPVRVSGLSGGVSIGAGSWRTMAVKMAPPGALGLQRGREPRRWDDHPSSDTGPDGRLRPVGTPGARVPGVTSSIHRSPLRSRTRPSGWALMPSASCAKRNMQALLSPPAPGLRPQQGLYPSYTFPTSPKASFPALTCSTGLGFVCSVLGVRHRARGVRSICRAPARGRFCILVECLFLRTAPTAPPRHIQQHVKTRKLQSAGTNNTIGELNRLSSVRTELEVHEEQWAEIRNVDSNASRQEPTPRGAT
ncbi:RCC1 domain-containing protein [Archangium sp.]|uniref:RCC1 domain-containing protein n=1 Tax=Archangium sp. TaxID=1872627 RepID=UPI002D3494DC|nr:RCC1 domain-containing protein [Archangium sp.]HYO56316.1 RCC1 domain-containing protein [Archangium sp.]